MSTKYNYFTVRLTSKIKSEDLTSLDNSHSSGEKGNIDILMDSQNIKSMFIVGEYNISIPSIEIDIICPNLNTFNVITENKGLYITVQLFLPGSSGSRRLCFITTKQSIFQIEKNQYGIKLNGLLFIYGELLDSSIRTLTSDPGSISNMDSEVKGISSSDAMKFLLFDTKKGIISKNALNIEYNSVIDKCPSGYNWYSSKDNMIWIQHNISNIEMIKQLVKHSYLKEMNDIKNEEENADDIDFLLFSFCMYSEMIGQFKEVAGVRAISYKDFMKYESDSTNEFYKIIDENSFSKLSMSNGSEVGDYKYRPGTRVSEFRYMDKSKIPTETFWTKLASPSKFFSDISRQVDRIAEHRHDYGNTHLKFNMAPYNNSMNYYNLQNMTVTLEYTNIYPVFELLDKVKISINQSGVPNIINNKSYIVSGVFFNYNEGNASTLVRLNRM